MAQSCRLVVVHNVGGSFASPDFLGRVSRIDFLKSPAGAEIKLPFLLQIRKMNVVRDGNMIALLAL